MSFQKIYEAQLNTALSWKCGGSTPAPQHCIRTSIVEVATMNLHRWRWPGRTLSLQLLHLRHFCERWLVHGWEWEGGGSTAGWFRDGDREARRQCSWSSTPVKRCWHMGPPPVQRRFQASAVRIASASKHSMVLALYNSLCPNQML